MTNFFYITGIIFWSIIALGIVAVALYYGWKAFSKYIVPSIRNIKFYFFGAKWIENENMAAVYFSRWSNKSGVRQHWHSRSRFRRLAYKRFLKEARKDMPAYLEELRKSNNQ